MSNTVEIIESALDCPTIDSAEAIAVSRATPADRLRGAVHHNAAVLQTVATSFGVYAIFTLQGIIMARLLGPEKRGEYGTIVFYTQALSYVGLLGTLLSVARYAAKHPQGLASLRRTAVHLGLATGCVTALLVAVLALTALPADKQFLAPLCIFCALVLPFEHVRLALLAVDHGSGAFSKYNRNLLIHASILPLALCVLLAADIRSLPIVAAVTILVPMAALAYRFGSERGAAFGVRAEPPVKSLIVEGVPYAVAQTSSTVFDRLDGFLMLWMASLTVQGYYTAAVSAGGLMYIVATALALFTFRASARSDGQMSVRRLIGAGVGLIAIQVVSLAALLPVLEILFVFVFGESFREAVPFARVLLWAHAIGGISEVAGGYLRGRRKPLVEVWSRIAGAAVMAGIFIAIRPHWHDMSVPFAAIGGHAVCALLICWSVFNDVREQNRPEGGALEIAGATT